MCIVQAAEQKLNIPTQNPSFVLAAEQVCITEVSANYYKSSVAQTQPLQEDETNIERVPNISQISYDVDYGMPNVIKGKEMIENPSAPAPRISRAPSNQSNATQSKKDVIMESMQSCRNQDKPTELDG